MNDTDDNLIWPILCIVLMFCTVMLTYQQNRLQRLEAEDQSYCEVAQWAE